MADKNSKDKEEEYPSPPLSPNFATASESRPLEVYSKTNVVIEDDEPKRETWNRKIDFLLACIGFSVGLGNVWRFPFLAFKNGGGAFLIPYLICVVIGGIPMFFLEVALGQFMAKGGILAWRICPIFIGIGYATTLIVFLLDCYYNVVLAWAFYYLFASFTTELPWSHCNNDYNDEKCMFLDRNGTNFTLNGTNITLEDPVDQFWDKKVLGISDGIDLPGGVKWDLMLCLLLAWIVVYLCIWKGIKTSGKVMYFTATSPYLLMLALLVCGCTLEGAGNGIIFYLKPNFTKMAEPTVWIDAGTQIFFSYSISLGTLTALGSYNQFTHNSFKDCMIFACVNSGTSIFAGFVIFTVLGHMAHLAGHNDVSKVTKSGPGLAFKAYPKALAAMPVAPLWSVMFFIMVILLGLDSQFVGVEGLVTAFTDLFPRAMRRGHNRELFILAVCFVCFLVGLSMVSYEITRPRFVGGMYVFQLFDYYSGSRIILLVAFFECMAIGWVYGGGRFIDNLEMMYGFRVWVIWKYMWMFVTPLFDVIMFVLCLYVYTDLSYGDYHFPSWSIGVGWTLAFLSVTLIPIVAVVRIVRTPGSLWERIRKLSRPRLKPHQMRHNDSVRDLETSFQAAYESPLKMSNISTG